MTENQDKWETIFLLWEKIKLLLIQWILFSKFYFSTYNFGFSKLFQNMSVWIKCPYKCRPSGHKDWEYCWQNCHHFPASYFILQRLPVYYNIFPVNLTVYFLKHEWQTIIACNVRERDYNCYLCVFASGEKLACGMEGLAETGKKFWRESWILTRYNL